ncbi:MAG: type II toxin-antitoxin system MqsA family antitoxin [Syntrophaceae bacterium]|mgnify:FL=1|jgi:HTH-type transcriptional regulator / antitoxin MqsA|nr:type II toxin-antitoxin system MqsA family antitoxin [Syntrophaceae bacterium]
MQCPFCGGQPVKATVTFAYEEDDRYLFIENVPADVCDQCGERIYAPEVTDELLRIAGQKLCPVRKIEVPVYDFVMNQ